MFLYFIIGCCIGSFLCLVAQRLPQGHSIIYPRSHCVNCQHVVYLFGYFIFHSAQTGYLFFGFCQPFYSR